MEDWQIDFEWLRIRHFVKDHFGYEKLPDFHQIMLLLGIQELGLIQDQFSKEEKQDLIHIATCTLLESQGYYIFAGRDEDGWPHWDEKKSYKGDDEAKNQELKRLAIGYFASLIESN